MKTPALNETATGAKPAVTARWAFDPAQLFAQRDRLPWFWFFVAVAVTLVAALDRYHLISQFKQRERVSHFYAGGGVLNASHRTWLTGEEFQAEYEQRRAQAIARRQMPQPVAAHAAAKIYQLKPRGKYVPNPLDSSGYPGTVVYRRPVVERTAAVPVPGGGLVKCDHRHLDWPPGLPPVFAPL